MKIKKEQCKDTGLVAGLVLMFTGLTVLDYLWIKIAFAVILISLIMPQVFYYPAVLWFGLSDILGKIVSKIVLGAVYAVVVLPVGLIRRLSKKDPMFLKAFRNSNIKSAWVVREHEYSDKDILKPF